MEVKNDLLGYKNMKIYQDTDLFSFSLDSVLLPNFVTINSKSKNILDIGCGNAPIPLILSTKTSANIKGVEIQKKAYDLAVKSVKENFLSNQINIINQDINELYLREESDFYDTITCNPPFFKINEKSKTNLSIYKKIARHEFNLNINQLFKIAKKLLKNNGNIAIVHRPERLIEIIEAMNDNNIEPKKLRIVYPKKNKEAIMILIEGTKNGNKGLKILSPLYTHNENNEYTDEIKKYFE